MTLEHFLIKAGLMPRPHPEPPYDPAADINNIGGAHSQSDAAPAGNGHVAELPELVAMGENVLQDEAAFQTFFLQGHRIGKVGTFKEPVTHCRAYFLTTHLAWFAGDDSERAWLATYACGHKRMGSTGSIARQTLTRPLHHGII
jgi:hypothetical protein